MVNCSFCGKVIPRGTGKIFVRDNGTVLNFCSSKCEKNMLKLKRDARKFKWTNFFVKGEAVTAPKVKTTKRATVTKKVTTKKTASKK